MSYDINSNFVARMWDHASYLMKGDIGRRGDTPKNFVEKAGDGLLFVTGLPVRAVKVIGRAFQDPRIVTIVLAALAILAISLVFYPATTVAVVGAGLTFTAAILAKVPFWAVKLATYIYSCAVVVAYAVRIEGRLFNSALMNKFYGLPINHPGNPCWKTADEIRAELARLARLEDQPLVVVEPMAPRNLEEAV